MIHTDLSQYSAAAYRPGNLFARITWYCTSMIFFRTAFPWPKSFKKVLLVLFGSKIGKGFVIKPCVTIKHPWFLTVGDQVWIGEGVWIDNLAPVTIGNHVCISQGSYLVSGSHDYQKKTFDLILKPINIKDGAWIAAKCVINPGVTIGSHSVIASGSVVTKDTEDFTVYTGNPARSAKERMIE